MKTFPLRIIAFSFFAASFLSACGADDHKHDHGHGDHNHAHESATEGHGHTHTPPHGGALVALGEEFAHLELVLDPATGKLTAYVLDGEAENPVRLKQEQLDIVISEGLVGVPSLRLTPIANSLTGETVGDTSEFSVQSDPLKGVSQFKASLKAISIKGQEFADVGFGFPEGNE